MKSKVGNRIDFANAILKNENKLKVNQECIKGWENIEMGSFGILKDISEHITLLQLMDYLVNVNNAISFVGC